MRRQRQPTPAEIDLWRRAMAEAELAVATARIAWLKKKKKH